MPAARQIRSHAALRGVAALLVVAYHLQFGAIDRFAIETMTPFLTHGYLWVDLFFVLSGFIIAYANDAERTVPYRWAEMRAFLRARLFRLYPLHLVCLLAFVAFSVLLALAYQLRAHAPFGGGDAHQLWLLLVQLLLLNAWSDTFTGWNIPSWSISAELVAYALFPLIVSAHAIRRRSSEIAMLAAATGFFASIAITTGDLDAVGGPVALARCVAGFLLGMLAFYHRRKIVSVPSWLLATLQIAACVTIVALVATASNDVWLPPLFVLLVWSTWTDRGPLPWLVARAPVLWLGDISYSIYLTHVPLIRAASVVWFPLQRQLGIDGSIGRAAWIALTVGLVLLVSRWTFAHVERPARQWLTRRWTGHAAPPIATAPSAP